MPPHRVQSPGGGGGGTVAKSSCIMLCHFQCCPLTLTLIHPRSCLSWERKQRGSIRRDRPSSAQRQQPTVPLHYGSGSISIASQPPEMQNATMCCSNWEPLPPRSTHWPSSCCLSPAEFCSPNPCLCAFCAGSAQLFSGRHGCAHSSMPGVGIGRRAKEDRRRAFLPAPLGAWR